MRFVNWVVEDALWIRAHAVGQEPFYPLCILDLARCYRNSSFPMAARLHFMLLFQILSGYYYPPASDSGSVPTCDSLGESR